MFVLRTVYSTSKSGKDVPKHKLLPNRFYQAPDTFSTLSLLSNIQMLTIHLITLDADWWNSLPVNEQVIRADEKLRVLPPSCLLD